MSSHERYPTHWCSFAIAGCIFALCFILFYWKVIRRNRAISSQYTPIDEAKPTEFFNNSYSEMTPNPVPSSPSIPSSSTTKSSAVFQKIFRLNENNGIFIFIFIFIVSHFCTF